MGLHGRPVADSGMPPAPIVKDFDVFEQALIRFPPEHFIHSGSKPLIINGIF
jgi:hypothetical protein